jgi:hypothetical protein
MVTSVQAKVRRLETASGGGGSFPPCDRCGWGGGEEPFDFGPDATFELVFDDDSEAEEEEYCPECGRRVNVVVRFEEDL